MGCVSLTRPAWLDRKKVEAQDQGMMNRETLKNNMSFQAVNVVPYRRSTKAMRP